jgi:hypothetical protein
VRNVTESADLSGGYRMPRRRSSLEPNTKRLALIACGIGGLLVVLFAGSYFNSRSHGGLPVIEADSRPLRVKPDKPDAPDVATGDDAILSGGTQSAAALAPPPETPAVAALKAEAAARAKAEAAVRAQAQAQAAAEAAKARETAVRATEAAKPPVQPVSLATPARPAVEPHPAAEAKPVAHEAIHPAVVRTGAGGAMVQLAALPSEEAAMAEWQRLEHRMPDVFGGRKPAVVKYARDGRTFWRLRTGGFADAAAAGQFCERVRAKGGGCSVASF